MDAGLEAKLRELIDRDEIWRVMQRYARGLDRLDVALVRACYWDDCIEDHSQYVGTPDGFIDWANAVARQYESTQHAILNHHCELDGHNAWCETYFQFTGVAAAPPHFMSVGRYVDHFQKRNGEWRIANRVTVVEGRFDIDKFHAGDFLPPVYGEGESVPATRDKNDVSYHRPPVPRRPKGA